MQGSQDSVYCILSVIQKTMSVKIAFCTVIAAALIGSGCETHEHHHHAKISKEQAMATASAQVPGGTVKEGELEKV